MTTPGIEVDLQGPFFKADIRKTVTENADDACKWLIRQGPPLIRGHLRQIKNPTGFTAGLPEAVPVPLPANSYFTAFGVVWPRPGASRGGSPLYPAARVPYIINAVLESGNYGGKRSPKRTAIKQWYRTFAAMRHMAARITVDMAKGLN